MDPKEGQIFIDATLGGGGYSRTILDQVSINGKVLSVDLDIDAIKNAEIEKSKIKNQNWIIKKGNFKNIDEIAKQEGFREVDGIVADLGLSSYELDQAGRGISFQKDEPLDMRFDQSQELTAEKILNEYTEERLRKIFEEYGEENFSRQISREVAGLRAKGAAIKTTKELFKVIEEALPKPVKHKVQDSARRIFQALRIEVNGEIENLKVFLPKAFTLLKSGGRLAVVSFHSLEDRIVKQQYLEFARGCVCPPEFPECVCGKKPLAKILTKKPLTASETELLENPRSKPAKLRVLEKI